MQIAADNNVSLGAEGAMDVGTTLRQDWSLYVWGQEVNGNISTFPTILL